MNHNYEKPATMTYRVALLLFILATVAMLFGFYRVFFYSVPMQMGHWHDAADSRVLRSEKANALYNMALAAESKLPQAASLYFNLALAQLVDKQGIIQPEDKPLAAEITFRLGNCLVLQRNVEGAKEAYRNALRLDPGHLDAKLNLELLTDNRNNKNNSPSKGEPELPEQGRRQNNSPPKKGI